MAASQPARRRRTPRNREGVLCPTRGDLVGAGVALGFLSGGARLATSPSVWRKVLAARPSAPRTAKPGRFSPGWNEPELPG